MIFISVITVCLNAVELIGITANSLREQSFQNFEWLVIDGGSTDGTVEVLDSFYDLPIRYISEADNGIYDAMNKALALATGSWAIFLGAGDAFFDSDSLSLSSERLNLVPPCYSFAYGGVSYSAKGSSVYYWPSDKANHFEDLSLSVPPHTATFTRKSVFKQRFESHFRILGDRLFMLQNSERKFFSLLIPVTVMLEGGVSYGTKNKWRKRWELFLISRACRARPGFAHYIRVLLAWTRDDIRDVLDGLRRVLF